MKVVENYQFDFFQNLSEKCVKNIKLLELISKKGIISRTEISKTTGINIVSVSNYINKYIENKLVLEKGFDTSTGGRKPELVELNKNDNFVIGVDIRKDSIRVVLSDIGMNIIGKAHELRPEDKPKEAVGMACGLIDEVIKKAALPPGSIKAVGVGTNSGDYAAIGKEVKNRFGIDTFVGDEPSCAAFGERSMNKKISSESMLYMYSDVGCGVFIDENGGRVSDGESRYLSAWNDMLGVVNLAKYDVARGVGTNIVEIAKGKMENITEETVIEATENKDEVALSIMRSVGMSLGLRIAYLINLFNPKTVIIGGGIEKSGDLVLEPIKKTVKRLSLKDRSGSVVIMPGLLGEESVSLGAASLAAREIFIKV